jgi:AhpC/TSA family protein
MGGECTHGPAVGVPDADGKWRREEMKWFTGLGALAGLAAMTLSGAAADEVAPKVGDKAPDFKLTASDGKAYTLAEFQGKSWVVIAWYPKAMTGG